jgi:hypothetical protein
MKFSNISLLILACGVAPLASQAGVDIGINIGGPEVIVHSQPPPERYESVGIAPGPGYVFVRGHWGWRHDRWEWMGGRWEVPARPGNVWISGQWIARGNGWVWMEGHYDVQMAAPPPQQMVVEVADDAPPAAIYETVPYAPGPDFFWIGGRWQWNGRWVWAHGHYDRHPNFHPGAGWEQGRWEHAGGHYTWREGHWR